MKAVIKRLLIGIILLQCSIIAFTSDPKFDPTTRMRLVLVPADAAVGSVIYRLRASDEEFDYPLTFELMGDASSSTVQIDSLKCTKYNSICQANVVLIQRLESGRYYDFSVSVKDTKGGIATQSCSITATNYTTPHNLIFPHKPSIIMLPEDAKRGTVLDYVIARKNPLYSKDVILELHGSPLFAIRQKIVSPQTTEGTIILLGPLDFETQSMYHLVVLANDAYAEPGHDSRNIAGFEVVIIVQDVQDVPPIFTIAPPVTKLSMSLLPGDKILQVHAEDGDKGNPREIRYGLVSEGNPFTSFFSINDTTGEIFLVKSIEEISAITHLGDPVLLTIIAEEVKITRNEPPSMATTVQIALFLPERINSPPYFENDHYIARIDENALQGTALIFTDPYTPRVYDDDTGKNGVFSLTLLENNGTFEISPNVAERHATFIIYVRDNHLLDYEMRHSVQFRILAQELSPVSNLSAAVKVITYINDVNDNPPKFAEEMYVAEIPENITLGSRIVQVHADDVDTGIGGRVRYTQIFGYLNTSLKLNSDNGLIIISTNNHGFDREMMPEYHLYVEARDNDGSGNSAQVPLILKIIDVNDNAPIFEKSIYEFILLSNLKNFTIPAFVKATDADAEEPNNIVRYEIISGNYENKFRLDKYTGQLMLTSPLIMNRDDLQTHGIITLLIRGYDLGVPVMFSTINVRIYPPESKTRSITFVLPGQNIDRARTEDILSTITGGRVIIHDIQPYNGNSYEGLIDGTGGGIGNIDRKDMSIISTTVLYDSNSVVDISQIQKRLQQNYSTSGISIRDNIDSENIQNADGKILFWLLTAFAVLILLGLLLLLLCCTCSCCPLYNATRKSQIIDRGSVEDDVQLVRREFDVDKQSKSVQVAEWMGRREAWSAEKSSDSRTKSTQWEFRRKNHEVENVGMSEPDIPRAPNEKSPAVRLNDSKITQEVLLHESHLVSHQDTNLNELKQSEHVIDSDSMRRHEIDRGSDAAYDFPSASKRGPSRYDEPLTNREQYFIKEGNAEILRLITRGKNDEENIFVNIPPQHPQYIMLENGGKEILMKRFIDEQVNGKHIIREHYQIVPPMEQPKQEAYMPDDQQDFNLNKQMTGNAIYPVNDQQYTAINKNVAQRAPQSSIPESQLNSGNANQSIIQQELEMSLKEQNALLRKILLEKERLQEKYSQQGVILETQSLPGHSTAIATQTDCDAGTQTDFNVFRRRARSENDDSMSEDEYEYIRYSPPDGLDNVYWMKREKHKRKKMNRTTNKPKKRVVLVEEVKRKIRTPIKEESEEFMSSSPSRRYLETKTSILRRIKNGNVSDHREKFNFSKALKSDVLMEISNSFDKHRKHSEFGSKYFETDSDFKNELPHDAEFFENGDIYSDNEIVIRRNNYSEDSVEEDTDSEKMVYYQNRKSNRDMMFPGQKPSSKRNTDGRIYVNAQANKSKSALNHVSRKRHDDKHEQYRRVTTSEPPATSSSRRMPKPHIEHRNAKRVVAQSEADLIHRLCDDEFETSKPVAAPRYMEWYYNMSKDSDPERHKERNTTNSKKLTAGSEKKIRSKKGAGNDQSSSLDSPNKVTPPKGARMLKEDVKLNKSFSRKSHDSNHPLLQYSEHRYEHEYNPAPDIPVPPTKLPHYMYPETPPLASIDSSRSKTNHNDEKLKSKIQSIPENDLKEQSSQHSSQTEINSNQNLSKQLNASTLEDDHDSGIAMNPLLHNLGKRNPIAEKKSVFTIAYDEATINKIQSESDSPKFS